MDEQAAACQRRRRCSSRRRKQGQGGGIFRLPHPSQWVRNSQNAPRLMAAGSSTPWGLYIPTSRAPESMQPDCREGDGHQQPEHLCQPDHACLSMKSLLVHGDIIAPSLSHVNYFLLFIDKSFG